VVETRQFTALNRGLLVSLLLLAAAYLCFTELPGPLITLRVSRCCSNATTRRP
jgi:hypothetical protein